MKAAKSKYNDFLIQFIQYFKSKNLLNWFLHIVFFISYVSKINYTLFVLLYQHRWKPGPFPPTLSKDEKNDA